ncbi:MAG: PD-(D/E)XK nuclease family protein [Gammaproteobacteria bacterium]|nr:PD-(D/E)XK nuclease family protein [Gammaproteobacteria bacterium]
MPDWLDAALRDSSQVVTASRRLARSLQVEYSKARIAAGATAWKSPEILHWQDWLSRYIADSDGLADLPARITVQQSRILWEQCVQREVPDPLLNIGMIVRQCRETWNRLLEWRIQLSECQRAARNRDQRLFARVADAYRSILRREHWIDDAGMAELALQQILSGRAKPAGKLTLAGFDRLTPQQQSVVAAIAKLGSTIGMAPQKPANRELALHVAESNDAELRTAGAWARQQLLQDPALRVAIIVTQLEQDAGRSLRLIKEGLIPGWQNASQQDNQVINISYGRKLLEYPAIAMALLALRWLHSDLTTVEVSRLLQSNLLDSNASDALARVELRLRQLPDQGWSPQALLAEISSGYGLVPGAAARIQHIAQYRERLPRRQSPAAWVAMFDAVLGTLGWPGSAPLDSGEFQLINRWRELLNDVARLELVSSAMTCGESLARIASIAAETVYQPESEQAVVQVLGPLEAAGLQFDRLWITGVSDQDWPARSRPLALLSRELQRSHTMPDATPADTLEFSRTVLQRLAASTEQLIASFASVEDGAQRSASELLHEFSIGAPANVADPGWRARALCESGVRLVRLADPVPPVTASEIISGGAATLQRQREDPFSAFVTGRLGVRVLAPIAAGLLPNLRGSLIHAALHRLYEQCPSRQQISAWLDADLDARIERAVQAAFRPREKNADAVLHGLLQLEKGRVRKLLRRVVELDTNRDFLRVYAVEQKLATSVAGINLRLRADRVDQHASGEMLIFDYKTGVPRSLLDRNESPRDLQLLVYARALSDAVGGIGLFNIDSRQIALDAFGRDQLPGTAWDVRLAEWQESVTRVAMQMAAGDVRVARWQTTRSARSLALLSRYQEILREQ